MRSSRISKVLLCCGALLILGGGCAGKRADTARLPPSAEVYQTLPRVAVVPILVNGLAVSQGISSADAADRFYHILFYQLERTYRFQVVSRRTTFQTLIGERPLSADLTDPTWTAVRQRAVEMQVPFLLICQLFRFNERQGDKYGVNTPASLGFTLQIIGARDGEVIWTQAYDETQRALSEDVLSLPRFVERRGQWVTVEDLAREALETMTASIPPLPEKP